MVGELNTCRLDLGPFSVNGPDEGCRSLSPRAETHPGQIARLSQDTCRSLTVRRKSELDQRARGGRSKQPGTKPEGSCSEPTRPTADQSVQTQIYGDRTAALHLVCAVQSLDFCFSVDSFRLLLLFSHHLCRFIYFSLQQHFIAVMFPPFNLFFIQF